jgi:hypothetical protein
MRTKQKEKKLTVAEQIGELKSAFDDHVQIETPQWDGIKTAIGQLNTKLDRILDVKINGTVGFENVIALLGEVTSSARWRKHARKAMASWTEKHPTIKSVAIWAVKKTITLALAIVVVWAMYKLGLGQLVEQIFRIAP